MRRPSLRVLQTYDWVLPPAGSYTRLTIEQAFVRAGLNGPRAAVTSMNFHANLRLASEGGLLAVAPRSAARAVQALLALAVFPLGRDGDDTDITLVWRESRLTNPALRALLECF